MAINSTGRRVLVNKGIYDSTLQYYPMDAVYYEGSYYICIKECVGVEPTDTNYWGYSHSIGDIGVSLGIRLSDGILYITDTVTTEDLGKVSILYRGEYSSTATYASLDVVTYEGSSYICIKDTTGNLPTDTTYFGLLCEGTEGRGITSVTLSENKHLVVAYTDGTSKDIGEVVIHTPLDQIDAASINSDGHLILSKDDGTTLDAGYAVGPKGAPGPKGEKGDPGSDATVTAQNIESALGYTPADKVVVDQLSKEIDNLASESEYELIGETPVTLEEISDIKIQASGETEYTIQTPTVGDFEQLLDAGKVALVNCAISKSKGYFEVVTTSDLTGFYRAYVEFVFDGLEIGKSYKIICNVANLTNNQPAKLWHGSFAVWSGPKTSGTSVVGSHMPHKGPVEFTASETSILVRYYPATNSPNLLAGWIGNFNSFYVNRAEMSDELTAIYSASGNFDGVLNAKSVPPTAVVSATPSANVYRKASTDITLTQAGKPADGKATGERIAVVASKMPLWGKTIANFGDSIFGDARPPLDVSTFLASNTGATVYNCAFGGCRMSQHVGHWDAFSMYRLAHAIANNDYALQDDALNYEDRVSYAEEPLALIKSIDFASLDILTIAYGTNDYTSSIVIDNPDNALDTTTVCGALRYSIETLLTAYPNLRIFVFLPTYRFWVNADNDNAFVEDSTTYTNSLGKTLGEYSEAIIKTAKAYNLPVIDNYTELGINKVNRYQYFGAADGVHHIEAGRKLLAKHIAAKLW